ncbi:MAG: dehydrogenase [Rikenellaceae bacterium]|nr:dehydrogenase [Rikenellaceae bacterium]
MIYRSKAPLRIGFAGGGTDVSPYSDIYKGAVLNATISLYARASIEPLKDKRIILQTLDRGERCEYDLAETLSIDGNMDLLKGVYNRICRTYGPINEGFCLSTSVDAPAGSGLGSSSTLVVAILGAFTEWLKLPLGSYDTAHMAYEIERMELNIAGGKQDQYTAAFGGFNYMEFFEKDKVLVNPLSIHKAYINELENNLLLYYTSTSRLSAEIIKKQQINVRNDNKTSIEAMHVIKKQAMDMKEALLRGNIDRMGELLHEGFVYKKRMAHSISNTMIDEIYDSALKAGALGGKISGAGGGGFMVFYCPDIKRHNVIEALKKYNGSFKLYNFVKDGLFTWSI